MWAYANYNDNMKFCEDFISFVAKKVLGTTKIKVEGRVIDLKTPWKRISMLEAIKKHAGVDFTKIKTFREAKDAAEDVGADVSKCDNWGEVVITVFEDLAQPKLIQPHIMIFFNS